MPPRYGIPAIVLAGDTVNATVGFGMLATSVLYASNSPVFVSSWFCATGLLLLASAIPVTALPRSAVLHRTCYLAPVRAWSVGFCAAVTVVAVLAQPWGPWQTLSLFQNFRSTLSTIPVALGVHPHLSFIGVPSVWVAPLFGLSSVGNLSSRSRAAARKLPLNNCENLTMKVTMTWGLLSMAAIVAALGYSPLVTRAWTGFDPSDHLDGYTVVWNTKGQPFEVHGMTIVPTAVFIASQPMTVDESWHLLTLRQIGHSNDSWTELATQSGTGRLASTLSTTATPHSVDRAMWNELRSHQRVVLYCQDAVVTAWSDTVECGANPSTSVLNLRVLIDGVGLIGYFTRVDMWQHWLLDGVPQLDGGLSLARQLLHGYSQASQQLRSGELPLGILCGPEFLCAATKKSQDHYRIPKESLRVYPGYGIGRQGHHIKQLLWNVVANGTELQGLQQQQRRQRRRRQQQQQQQQQQHPPLVRLAPQSGMLYPRGSYDALSAMFQPVNATDGRYVLFVSREDHSRHLDDAGRAEFLRRLQVTLQSQQPAIELRIFRHTEGQQADRVLFNGALAVIGVHGGGLVNTMFCRERSVIVEIQPWNCHPRLHCAAIAYARGIKHYTFNAREWIIERAEAWYSYEPIRVDAAKLHGFVVDVLRLEHIVVGVY